MVTGEGTMRQLGVKGAVLALLLGLAWPALAAEPGDAKASSGSWWSGWFGGKDKKPDSKPVPADEGPVVNVAPLIDRSASDREREENAYFRRMAVCDRLMQLAVQTNNQDQQRRIDQLKERVWALYQQRTAHLSGSLMTADSDEAALEQSLPTTGRSSVLPLPEQGRAGGARAGVYREGER
jgi:hypothetical protein